MSTDMLISEASTDPPIILRGILLCASLAFFFFSLFRYFCVWVDNDDCARFLFMFQFNLVRSSWLLLFFMRKIGVMNIFIYVWKLYGSNHNNHKYRVLHI